MWNLNAAVLFLLLPILILNNQQANGCHKRAAVQDSLVLANSNGPLVIKNDGSAASVQLKASKQHSFSKSKNFCLLMDGVQVKQLPEGVYEIYLTPSNTKPADLDSESGYFINVLDTYTLGSDEGHKHVCIDVTTQLHNQNGKSSQLLPYQVTILFKGNRKGDGTSARNAGNLIIKTVKLIQI